MKILTVFTAALAAALLITAPAAYATGTPISGTSVGLEHDPEGIIAHGATNDGGNFTFANLKPGSYAVVLPSTSGLKAAACLSLAGGGAHFTSAPILPGKGSAYALDKSGSKILIVIKKAGDPITVNLSTVSTGGGKK